MNVTTIGIFTCHLVSQVFFLSYVIFVDINLLPECDMISVGILKSSSNSAGVKCKSSSSVIQKLCFLTLTRGSPKNQICFGMAQRNCSSLN